MMSKNITRQEKKRTPRKDMRTPEDSEEPPALITVGRPRGLEEERASARTLNRKR